jgi:hypothetical protein
MVKFRFTQRPFLSNSLVRSKSVTGKISNLEIEDYCLRYWKNQKLPVTLFVLLPVTGPLSCFLVAHVQSPKFKLSKIDMTTLCEKFMWEV